jgi:hypothetical protein
LVYNFSLCIWAVGFLKGKALIEKERKKENDVEGEHRKHA